METFKKVFLITVFLTAEHLFLLSFFSQKSLESPIKPKDQKLLLYIMIMTAPGNTEKRQDIRETWLKDVKDRNSYIQFNFFIGINNITLQTHDLLLIEQAEYQDIIFLCDFEEGFQLTTYKVLKMLKWAHQHINSDYYFKVDDDCYLSVDIFVKVLTSEGLPRKKMLLGKFKDAKAVVSTGRWGELNWYLCGVYLPYPLGAGYLLTSDLVEFIAVNNDKLEFYANEDSAIGAWVAGLNITYQNELRISMSRRTCKKDSFLFHNRPSINLKEIHQLQLTPEGPCSRYREFVVAERT